MDPMDSARERPRGTTERIYSALVTRHPDGEDQLPADVRANIPTNGLHQVVANGLQSSGDQTVNASTVLPWLFAVLGVPPALTGLLVPIRESGSMLPQAALTPLIVTVRYRKHVLVIGALIEAAAVAVMAATAALADGLTAGIIIVLALAVFSIGRCLTSIASKDVQGRTLPKGERGQINGLATTAAGLVAITLGVAIRLLGGENLSATAIAWLLAAGALLWVGYAVVAAGIREPAPDSSTSDDDSEPAPKWFADTVALLGEDAAFRRFVTVRSLLLVSALSPPFIVTLSIQSGATSLAGLGGFIIASGLAALLGGRIFGRMADRSSKTLMSIGAGVASAIIIATVVLVALPSFSGEGWLGNGLFILAYFALTLMHTGVRVARKTYVVDMAEGDTRTRYVAVSNSALGVILLVVGGASAALALIHVSWALLLLAVLGVIGVVAGARLPDVSQGKK